MNIKTSLKIELDTPDKWVEVCSKGFFYLCCNTETLVKEGDGWKPVASVSRFKKDSLYECILSIIEPELRRSISAKMYLNNLKEKVQKYESC